MRHLKRFRNWLTNVYYKRALPQRLGISDSHRNESVAEQKQGHQPAADVTFAESLPAVVRQPSQRPETVRSSVTQVPTQAVEEVPIQIAASTPTPENIVKEARIREEPLAAPVAEPEKLITTAQEVATEKQAADQPSTVSPSEKQAPQTVATDDKPEKLIATAQEIVTEKRAADQPSTVSPSEKQAPQTVATDDKPQGAEAVGTDEACTAPNDQPEKLIATAQEIVTEKRAADQPSTVSPPKTQGPQTQVTDDKLQGKEAVFADDGRPAPIDEPKKTVTPTSEVATGPRKADQPSRISKPEAQAPPSVSAPAKPQGAGTVEVRVAPIANPKKVNPVREVATVPRKVVADRPAPVSQSETKAPLKVSARVKPQGTGSLVTAERRVAPVANSKKPVTPGKEVATLPRKTVADQPSAVSQPEAKAPPRAAAHVKPQDANDKASAGMSRRGKYDPGTMNDQTAQRLARLLVSEIKLYNIGKIEAAGEVNNIYDLLKDPIDKSRQHYRQRLGKTAIETMPDYFHVELVRSLCAGDPSRLGPNYKEPDERN